MRILRNSTAPLTVLRLLFIAVLSIQTGCFQRGQVTSKEQAKKTSSSVQRLTEVEAIYRSERVSGVSYHNQFDLQSEKQYSGVTSVKFQLSKPGDLHLDFMGGVEPEVKVNGSETLSEYDGYRLQIKEKDLKMGENTIVISYSHPYGKTGVGLYQFIDPVDQRRYLYTDFEPFDANQMFPCFDQPDIKATYETTVTTPLNWRVISSTLETSKKQEGSGASAALIWRFPKSDLFSTYIYSLHAGPYKVWTSQAVTKNHRVPLRLFARQSVASHIRPKAWFYPTQKGFEFYEDYFAVAYPYKKYDQVVVPDFNSGAMENVAAVTFNERRYTRKAKDTRQQYYRRTMVILHELAHMWFGNLVTMKWWNDLWLNESFATYMSFLALDDIGNFPEGWLQFQRSSKGGAYWEDQLNTTHPIVNSVSDTQSAFAVFDAITYGKGASALRQLSYYMGTEKFKKGVQSYFKKYARKNTVLKQFITELDEQTPLDLIRWKKLWLEAAEMNRLRVAWKSNRGKVQSISGAVVLQGANNKKYDVLRPHRLELAVLKFSKPDDIKRISILIDGKETAIKELEGLKTQDFDFIYLNGSDYGYLKQDFTELKKTGWLSSEGPNTLLKHRSQFKRVKDDQIRLGLYGLLFDAVMELHLEPTKFLDVILDSALDESNEVILTYMLSLYSKATELVGDLKLRMSYQSKVLQKLYGDGNGKRSKGLQEIWLEMGLVNLTKANLELLDKLMSKARPPHYKAEMTSERRWLVYRAKARLGVAGTLKSAKAYLDQNPTAGAQKSYLAVTAAWAHWSDKQSVWQKLQKGPGGEFSLGKLRVMARAFYGGTQPPIRSARYSSVSQEEASEQMLKTYYQVVGEKYTKWPMEFLREVARLAPAHCTEGASKAMREFLAQYEDAPLPLIKALRIRQQVNDRCVKVRKHWKKQASN